MSDDDFLSRWSRRKHQARKGEVPEEPVAPAAAPSPPLQEPPVPDEAPLPSLESLTPESDFTPFMRGKVDPATRNQALKTLFSDPRYNIMDGLDVYIDDYSKPDPLPEGWLEKMTQVARMGIWQPPAEVEAAPDSGATLPDAKADPEPEPPAALPGSGKDDL